MQITPCQTSSTVSHWRLFCGEKWAHCLVPMGSQEGLKTIDRQLLLSIKCTYIANEQSIGHYRQDRARQHVLDPWLTSLGGIDHGLVAALCFPIKACVVVSSFARHAVILTTIPNYNVHVCAATPTRFLTRHINDFFFSLFSKVTRH